MSSIPMYREIILDVSLKKRTNLHHDRSTIPHPINLQTHKIKASKKSSEQKTQKNTYSRDSQQSTWPISTYDDPYRVRSIQTYLILICGYNT